jgi:hypothetical protein
MLIERRTQALRHEHFDSAAEQLVTGIPELPFQLTVDEGDSAVRVDDDHPGGQ